MKKLDILGKTFTRLTVLEERGRKCLVRCSCGTEKLIYRGNLLAGYTTSCGCLRNERTSAANIKHGHARNDASKTPTYRTWRAMLSRCRNPMRDNAHRYIGRGIGYDPSWEVFENFLRDMGERPEGLELDRKDNNLGYCKDNCRWITHKDNCNNRGY